VCLLPNGVVRHIKFLGSSQNGAEELSNRHRKRLREKPSQRFGFSLAPNLAPTQKRSSVSRPKQGLKGWLHYSEASRFDQSRSLRSLGQLLKMNGIGIDLRVVIHTRLQVMGAFHPCICAVSCDPRTLFSTSRSPRAVAGAVLTTPPSERPAIKGGRHVLSLSRIRPSRP
jgi:hypothetical protein